MKLLSLVWGILAMLGMLLGFIPCLGAYNWINIPFAVIGLIIGIIAVAGAEQGSSKTSAIAGIIMCAAAIVFGFFRLVIGGGIL